MTKKEPHEPTNQARRRLLKAAVYVAPAIVSVVVVDTAHAQTSSCMPIPCMPDGGP